MWFALAVILYLWIFWALYVLVMGLYRAQLAKQLTTTAKVLGAPFLIIGYSVDLLSNWTIAVIWFQELPYRPLELVTDRLIRYINTDIGFRQRHAQWLCTNLLDYFDPSGRHCQ